MAQVQTAAARWKRPPRPGTHARARVRADRRGAAELPRASGGRGRAGRRRRAPAARAARHGISTIVDVTVIGQGRNIPRIKRIAEQVPELNIVVATGVYTFDAVPLFFWRRPRGAMTEFFVRDITEGIAGTGVKAGMLKCAVDTKGLTEGVERVLRAVRRRTSRPAARPSPSTRTPAAQHGPAIVAGAQGGGRRPGPGRPRPLGRRGPRPRLPGAMADTGLTLGMDRFGIDHFATFEDRSDLVVEMCRRGYAGRMVLAHDTCCYIDWFGPRHA